MNAYVFVAQTSANTLQSTVDSHLGFPSAGVNVGGGVHVSPNFVTTTYQKVFANSGQTQFAYPIDATSTPVLATAVAALAGQGIVLPSVTGIDATWSPTS